MKDSQRIYNDIKWLANRLQGIVLLGEQLEEAEKLLVEKGDLQRSVQELAQNAKSNLDRAKMAEAKVFEAEDKCRKVEAKAAEAEAKLHKAQADMAAIEVTRKEKHSKLDSEMGQRRTGMQKAMDEEFDRKRRELDKSLEAKEKQLADLKAKIQKLVSSAVED